MDQGITAVNVSAQSSIASVALELVEQAEAVRTRANFTSKSVAILTVADRHTDWATLSAILERVVSDVAGRFWVSLQCLSASRPPLGSNLIFQTIFSITTAFRGAPLDDVATAESLRYLTAAFALSMPSRMHLDGFEAFRSDARGTWLVSVEFATTRDTAKRAREGLNTAIRLELFPVLSARVRAAFEQRAKGIRLPIDDDAPFGRLADSWVFACGTRATSIRDIYSNLASYPGSSHAALLADELIRIEQALSDTPISEGKIVDCESLVRIHPLPALGHSEILRKTDSGLQLEREYSRIIDQEFFTQQTELKRHVIARHHSWCRPNSPSAAERRFFRGAFDEATLPDRHRSFMFVPSPVAIDDFEEVWTLAETAAYLNFAQF